MLQYFGYVVAHSNIGPCLPLGAGTEGQRGLDGGRVCVCVCECAGDDDTSVGSNLGANKNYTLPYKQAKEVKMREEL